SRRNLVVRLFLRCEVVERNDSISHCETLANNAPALQFVDHGHGIVLNRNFALAVCVDQKLVPPGELFRSVLPAPARPKAPGRSIRAPVLCAITSRASIVAKEPGFTQSGKSEVSMIRTPSFT